MQEIGVLVLYLLHMVTYIYYHIYISIMSTLYILLYKYYNFKS